MKNSFKFISVALLAFAIGLTTANFAVSGVPSASKVAVVDLQKVFNSSLEIKALKEEQNKKSEELAKFIQTAQTSIDKETDKTKKKALEQKYTKEFATKKQAILKNYETKLLAVKDNIQTVVNNQAKTNGYDLILVKDVVLLGGNDITDEISKQIK